MPMMTAVGVRAYGGLTQVRLRVHAATVNPGDVLLRTGLVDEIGAEARTAHLHNERTLR
ncbi:hypothetical protein H7J88_01750 [Mycolicibacterium flavescens]|uniref:hypothetical protein n=1 Tax=Mycolicibacterium flavescens TaxID=1776 RepID=UPI00197BE174|nr:hypothetical protein [Mycolicibacterium flavescens]MCV7278369.1 hypothetical protein [Mycolicibacterium flavescens]